jgi:hypothetical protein
VKARTGKQEARAILADDFKTLADAIVENYPCKHCTLSPAPSTLNSVGRAGTAALGVDFSRNMCLLRAKSEG